MASPSLDEPMNSVGSCELATAAPPYVVFVCGSVSGLVGETEQVPT
jgi:hypothetical protein